MLFAALFIISQIPTSQIPAPAFPTVVTFYSAQNAEERYITTHGDDYYYTVGHHTAILENCSISNQVMCLRYGRNFEIAVPFTFDFENRFSTENYTYIVSNNYRVAELGVINNRYLIEQYQDDILIMTIVYSDRCGVEAFTDLSGEMEESFYTRYCGFLAIS